VRELLDQVLVLPPLRRGLPQTPAKGVELFNESMGNKDWNEVLIHVYDKFERYAEHLRRVELVLEARNGICPRRGMGTDTAHILLPVRTYRLRLLTSTAPERIKSFSWDWSIPPRESASSTSTLLPPQEDKLDDSDRRKGASRETLGQGTAEGIDGVSFHRRRERNWNLGEAILSARNPPAVRRFPERSAEMPY
jgi:hypothetical protein